MTKISSNKVLEAFHSQEEQLSVNEIAERLMLSSSRVRELIKAAGSDLSATDTKPAYFSISARSQFVVAESEETEVTADELDEVIAANELPAEVNPFNGLGKIEHTEPEPDAPADDAAEPVLLQDIIAALPKAKKAPINPQPTIDKKVEIMEAAGGSITYAARTWTITLGDEVVTLTSKEFSTFKGEEILSLFEVEGNAEELYDVNDEGNLVVGETEADAVEA